MSNTDSHLRTGHYAQVSMLTQLGHMQSPRE
jgi:hypothetical protein